MNEEKENMEVRNDDEGASENPKTVTCDQEEDTQSSLNVTENQKSEFCMISSLPSELIRRISTFLSPKDAVGGLSMTSKSIQSRSLRLSYLPPRLLLMRKKLRHSPPPPQQQQDNNIDRSKTMEVAWRIPLFYNRIPNVSIHSIGIQMSYFASGTNSKVSIVGKKQDYSFRQDLNVQEKSEVDTKNIGATTENGNDFIVMSDDKNESDYTRIIYEKSVPPHAPSFGPGQPMERINFSPRDGESYYMCFRNEDPNGRLLISDIGLSALVFDDTMTKTLSPSFSINYNVLLQNGILEAWDKSNSPRNSEINDDSKTPKKFLMDLLQSTCQSLRMQMEENGSDAINPTVLIGFFDRYGIDANTPSSLLALEGVLEAEQEEKREYYALLQRQKEKFQHGQNQEQRRDGNRGGVVVGGGIRITIDQRININGNEQEAAPPQIHQFHFGQGGNNENRGDFQAVPINDMAGLPQPIRNIVEAAMDGRRQRNNRNDDDQPQGQNNDADNENNNARPQPRIFVQRGGAGPAGFAGDNLEGLPEEIRNIVGNITRAAMGAAVGNNNGNNNGNDNDNNNNEQRNQANDAAEDQPAEDAVVDNIDIERPVAINAANEGNDIGFEIHDVQLPQENDDDTEVHVVTINMDDESDEDEDINPPQRAGGEATAHVTTQAHAEPSNNANATSTAATANNEIQANGREAANEDGIEVPQRSQRDRSEENERDEPRRSSVRIMPMPDLDTRDGMAMFHRMVAFKQQQMMMNMGGREARNNQPPFPFPFPGNFGPGGERNNDNDVPEVD